MSRIELDDFDRRSVERVREILADAEAMSAESTAEDRARMFGRLQAAVEIALGMFDEADAAAAEPEAGAAAKAAAEDVDEDVDEPCGSPSCYCDCIDEPREHICGCDCPREWERDDEDENVDEDVCECQVTP